jgi:hypothetical protein
MGLRVRRPVFLAGWMIGNRNVEMYHDDLWVDLLIEMWC